jgi:hypothetical protein
MNYRQHFESTTHARVRSQTLPSPFRRLIGRTIRWPCPMMTTAPNAHVAKVHDRQVVTRGPDQFSAWLDGTAGTEILVPAPEEAIRYWPVSKRINSVKAPREDKTLIEPVTLEPELGPALLV